MSAAPEKTWARMPLRDQVAYTASVVVVVLGFVGVLVPGTTAVIMVVLVVGTPILLVWYFVFQRPKNSF
jgi:hypothetical protein